MYVYEYDCRTASASAPKAAKDDDSGLPAEYLSSPLYKQSIKESESPAPGGE